MKRLQKEHAEWLARMFPEQPAWLPAAGMVEEAGELLSVLIKSGRIQRWGAEGRYANKDWNLELTDAVGDCALYCCSLCNALGWDFATIVEQAACVLPDRITMLQLSLELVQCAASVTRQPLQAYAVCYISLLKSVCAVVNLDFEHVVRTTWLVVQRRQK